VVLDFKIEENVN